MYSPTQTEFLNLKLAEQGNLIPVTRRLLADFETPLSAYRKIRGQGDASKITEPQLETPEQIYGKK